MMTGSEQFERTAESFNGTADAAALLTIDFDPNKTFLTGDFNDDGTIDLADFQVLLNNFNTGTTFAEGDATFDGAVDLRDFNSFRESFNAVGGDGCRRRART